MVDVWSFLSFDDRCSQSRHGRMLNTFGRLGNTMLDHVGRISYNLTM